MRLILTALLAIVTTPTLAADSGYTATALAQCIRSSTEYTTRVTLESDLKAALMRCAVLYRIHRIVALSEGATGEEVDNDFRDGVGALAVEIMGR